MPRIIDEYPPDASAELGVPRIGFTDADWAWVREHAATSLGEIEKAHAAADRDPPSHNLSAAAERLGMASGVAVKVGGARKLVPNGEGGPMSGRSVNVARYVSHPPCIEP